MPKRLRRRAAWVANLRYSLEMKTETEVKFLKQNHETIRATLSALGATCIQPMRLMKRAIIDFPDRRLQTGEPNSFIRVRDEGDKVTLTYKQFHALSVDGAKEIETSVGSFGDTVRVFTAIGLEVVSLQESKRETWKYDECEIVLDVWPWLDPYIEIEGESEKSLKTVSSQLALNWDDAVFGDVMAAYRAQYPQLTEKDTVGSLKEVRFGAPLPQSWVR